MNKEIMTTCFALPGVGTHANSSQDFNLEDQRIATLVGGVDFATSDAFAEALEELRSDFRTSGFRYWVRAGRIRRVLNNADLFEKVYRHALNCAAASFVAVHGDNAVEAAANGEFAKWFLEWFADGGWEIIVNFIKEIIGVIG